MNNVKTMVASILLGAVWLAANASAAPLSITLPQETAQLKPSTHPGYVIATQMCAICHSADYINQQPGKMSLTQWTAEVAKMQHAYGAPLSDDQVKQIGEYLAITYGSEKPAAAP
ncbi:cytochrome c [Collimonas sp.]|jgi:cytochrome c553|uniref:SorB family sulfite dehydrogenase c-type cytochrome subunit n=1 Tax=Collimonas sp. TaxID=1963772 RepID=UPI002BA2DD9C|nr:cytochrome c [Collimonas sp.]HWW07039.1 cytochrome c [Collimonas sp.]